MRESAWENAGNPATKEKFSMKKFVFAMAAIAILAAKFVVPAHADALKEKQKALDKARFVAYNGKQRDWPRSKDAAMVENNKYGVPIYHSLPDKPYEVVGIINATSEAFKWAARAANAAGADAILVANDPAFAEAGINIQPEAWKRKAGGGWDWYGVSKSSQVSAILIRWKK
jgi:hypothetical protein